MKSKRIICGLFSVILLFILGCNKSNNSNTDNTGEDETVKITTYDPQDITDNSVVCGGDVVVLEQGLSLSKIGVCWSTSENPTIDDYHVYTENWNEPFVCTISTLLPQTTYYIRAYAMRGLIVYYGEEKTFVTKSKPLVNTIEVNNVSLYSAIGVGEVVSEGSMNVTERGLCWNLLGNPTIMNNHASNGTGLGLYSVEITGLTLGTTYHVRAYAISEIGISYGSEIIFTTLTENPSISVIDESGFIQSGDTLTIGYEYNFGFLVSANVETNVGLASLSIWVDNELWDEVNLLGVSSYRYTDNIQYYYILGENNINRQSTVKAVLTDLGGKTSSASICVIINDLSEQLDVEGFEWIKTGSEAAIGLEEFGLQWIYNAKDEYAQIEPLNGASLFSFSVNNWNTIQTRDGKEALFVNAIENNAQISVFGGINVSRSKLYDYLIGTIALDGSLHIIHITRAVVSNTGDVSSVIITGDSK